MEDIPYNNNIRTPGSLYHKFKFTEYFNGEKAKAFLWLDRFLT